jgi:HEAT repeat protein
MKHEPIPEWTEAEVEAALERGEPEELARTSLAAALHSGSAEWAQDVCLRLAQHPEPSVRGNAVLALGHIARLHRRLDEQRVRPVITRALADGDAFVRGQADAAADDIEHFLKWRLR